MSKITRILEYIYKIGIARDVSMRKLTTDTVVIESSKHYISASEFTSTAGAGPLDVFTASHSHGKNQLD
jgi:hypothetical protein